MTARAQVLFALAVLLLSASLALAAAAAPATQQAPAATVAQPFTPLSTGAPICPAANLPVLSPSFQPAAGALCGPCSDEVCEGKAEFFVCGSGLRCLAQGTCSTTAATRCKCLII